ncbi:T-complex protein 1 subunit eta-like [Asparagus officinalis]|uniref:T-complex protein 1 subunit eta-like n=1 Tax=Asparagus officinalis TaxID=4686 RepID=UPI00098E19F6|nr:T-complex protein 1 subunit eta-like [Asparagus officinalis]
MAAMLQPQIILLKEGTDTSQGKAQVVSNINACTTVADTVRTTLGPRGMDKLIHDDKGNTTISNDGATIMKLLDIVHPAAKILVDIAKSQDSEVMKLVLVNSMAFEGLSSGKKGRFPVKYQLRHSLSCRRFDVKDWNLCQLDIFARLVSLIE